MNDVVRWLTEPVNWVLVFVAFLLGGVVAHGQHDWDKGDPPDEPPVE